MKNVDQQIGKDNDQNKIQNDMKNEAGQKNQTILDFCREQGIAFTDNDKMMYCLQNSRKMHQMYENFMNNDTKIVNLK